MGTGNLSRCRQHRYATGEPDKYQGRDRVGIVEESCGYRVLVVSNRGNIVLSRNLGCKTRGVAMAKRSSEWPWVAYPRRQSLETGHSASCGYIYPLWPTGAGPRGNSLPPFGTMWGLEKNPVGTGPAGSVFGENSYYRETRGTRRRGSPCG